MMSRHCNKGIPKECHRTWGNRTNDKRAEIKWSEDQLKGLLKRYDSNGDGKLSKEELLDAFSSFGSTFPAFRAWRALRHADSNHDGSVDEEELEYLVKYIHKIGYTIR